MSFRCHKALTCSQNMLPSAGKWWMNVIMICVCRETKQEKPIEPGGKCARMCFCDTNRSRSLWSMPTMWSRGRATWGAGYMRWQSIMFSIIFPFIIPLLSYHRVTFLSRESSHHFFRSCGGLKNPLSLMHVKIFHLGFSYSWGFFFFLWA